jgi:hypothetical protein
MKKAGIITLYYNNKNYGGLLQSFALVEAVKKIGVYAKQISYDRSGEKSAIIPSRKYRLKNNPVMFFKTLLKKRIGKILYRIIHKKDNEKIREKIKKRNDAFSSFEIEIPHTATVNRDNIKELNNDFDIFICGSDQIWNPQQFRKAYTLDFVDKGKKKIAYAASLGTDSLEDFQLEYLNRRLSDFDLVSLREENMVELFENSCLSADPTLLLNRKEWDNICVPYRIEEPYIFVYFLGESKEQRQKIKEYAKRNGLKIAAFPHILGKYRSVDEGFADIELYDVTPSQWIYLIKHADCVATDSFHACVFSLVYSKNFIAFKREDKTAQSKASSRLTSLLHLAGEEKRFIGKEGFSEIPENNKVISGRLSELIDNSYAILEKELKKEG